MSKKFVYFFSALTMLALSVAIVFIFSKPLPAKLATNNAEQEAIRKPQNLEKLNDIMVEIDVNATGNSNTFKQGSNPPINKDSNDSESSSDTNSTISNMPDLLKKNDIDAKAREQALALAMALQGREQEIKKPSADPITAPNKNADLQNSTEKSDSAGVVKLATVQKPAEVVKPQTAGLKLIAEAKLAPKGNASTIIYNSISEKNNNFIFKAVGNKSVSGKTFRLENPERIVLDIKGEWVVNLPKIYTHPMLKAIRSGKTKTHTRLVFDLHKKSKSTKLVQIDDKNLELTFN